MMLKITLSSLSVLDVSVSASGTDLTTCSERQLAVGILRRSWVTESPMALWNIMGRTKKKTV
jgi:hypothetical protein